MSWAMGMLHNRDPKRYITNSTGFFSRPIVCTFSDSFCIMADSSLFSAIELLVSFLDCWRAGTHGTAAHCAIAICILVVTLYIQYHVLCYPSCKYWLCLACKLKATCNRYMHAIVNAPRILHFSASFLAVELH